MSLYQKGKKIAGAGATILASATQNGLMPAWNAALADKFVVATAGSNGDFKITLIGTLATNDVIRIAFPAATNGASNARLSVDNGTTYKDIKLSTIRIASEVASRKLSFVYDGTDFVPLETEFFPIAYTPVVTAQTGTMTSYSAVGKYVKIGKVVHLTLNILITNVGTGTNALFVTLPLAATEVATGAVTEVAVNSLTGAIRIPLGSTGVIVKYDGGALFGTNWRLYSEVTYITA
jgi:hypothetical protein